MLIIKGGALRPPLKRRGCLSGFPQRGKDRDAYRDFIREAGIGMPIGNPLEREGCPHGLP